MTYEKLSRGLRYYYECDMMSKVRGKRLMYKFVCDLKKIVGFDLKELSDMVNGAAKQPRERRYPPNGGPDENN